MSTTIDEIADGIHRISTFLPDVTPVEKSTQPPQTLELPVRVATDADAA